MAHFKNLVLEDDSNKLSRLTAYLNSNNKVFIEVGEIEGDGFYSGYICLDRQDTLVLIAELQNLLKQMK